MIPVIYCNIPLSVPVLSIALGPEPGPPNPKPFQSKLYMHCVQKPLGLLVVLRVERPFGFRLDLGFYRGYSEGLHGACV